MKSHKYRDDVSVTWTVVLKAMENRVRYERKQFEYHKEMALHELSHKAVKQVEFEFWLKYALIDCEQAFKWYDTLCSLRQFLGMKPKKPEQLYLRQCYEFYKQYGGAERSDVA